MNELERLKHELLDCCERYPQLIKQGFISVQDANWGIQNIINKIKELTSRNKIDAQV